ncbi:MAG TPA: hypothetical protein VIY72_02295, partial [Acidimicrobiales bacterium]
RPDRVNRVVMVDGGPAPDPATRAEDPPPDPVAHVLERLARTWPSVAAYQASWRTHPGLAPYWNDYVDRLLADELAGDPPELHASLRPEAVVADAATLVDDPAITEAFRALRVPVVTLRAPRNMIDVPAPMFPDAQVERWRELVPHLHDILVPDVNHYTILYTETGARAVADVLREHRATI